MTWRRWSLGRKVELQKHRCCSDPHPPAIKALACNGPSPQKGLATPERYLAAPKTCNRLQEPIGGGPLARQARCTSVRPNADEGRPDGIGSPATHPKSFQWANLEIVCRRPIVGSHTSGMHWKSTVQIGTPYSHCGDQTKSEFCARICRKSNGRRVIQTSDVQRGKTTCISETPCFIGCYIHKDRKNFRISHGFTEG